MKRMIALLFALSVGGGAQASLITHNGYTLDTNTNIVTGGGLEWLQWDETIGASWSDVTDASSYYFLNGWEVASHSQMAGLYNHWGFGGISWDSVEHSSQQIFVDSSEMQAAAALSNFVELFGITDVLTDQFGADRFYSSSIYGEDANGDGNFNVALVTTSSDQTSGTALNTSDGIRYYDSRYNGGVALVRSAEPVSVPEPSTLALLGLGLIGLTARRRK